MRARVTVGEAAGVVSLDHTRHELLGRLRVHLVRVRVREG